MNGRGGRRLPFLLFFTVLTIVPSAIIGPTPAVLGATLFAIANFAYQAALIYYDATLKTVSLPATRGRLSGIGVGVGYMGTIAIGLTLLLFHIPAQGIFLISGVRLADVPAALGQLPETIRDAREVAGLPRFLLGRFFYSDAVNTIIVVMSVIAVRAMGMTTGQFILVSIFLTVVAIVASLLWGRLVDRYGPKRTLLWVLASWAVGLVIGAVALGMPGTVPGVALFLLAGAIVG